MNAANIDTREYVTAGDWSVYLGNADGKATFHKKITVGDDARDFKVVSR